MARVEQMCLEILEIAAVRSCAFRREDEVVLSPYDQCRRLVFSEEILKIRVEGNVGAVVVHQIHLDVAIAGTVEADLIEGPCRWVEQRQVADAVLVLPARRFRLDQEMNRSALLGNVLVPVGLDRVPELRAALRRRHFRSAQ